MALSDDVFVNVMVAVASYTAAAAAAAAKPV